MLPDGCADVLFDLRNPSRARFVGAMTTAAVQPPRSAIDVVGVRFEPGAARIFLEEPLAALTDSERAVEDEARDAIAERLRSGDRGALDEWLLARLARADRLPDRAVVACVRHIESRAGRLALGDLEQLTGWTARHLERRFAEEVGFGPKRFARIVRFRAALEVAPRVARGDWAATALRLGYSDQSHLLREVRALAGVPLRVLRP